MGDNTCISVLSLGDDTLSLIFTDVVGFGLLLVSKEFAAAAMRTVGDKPLLVRREIYGPYADGTDEIECEWRTLKSTIILKTEVLYHETVLTINVVRRPDIMMRFAVVQNVNLRTGRDMYRVKIVESDRIIGCVSVRTDAYTQTLSAAACDFIRTVLGAFSMDGWHAGALADGLIENPIGTLERIRRELVV